MSEAQAAPDGTAPNVLYDVTLAPEVFDDPDVADAPLQDLALASAQDRPIVRDSKTEFFNKKIHFVNANHYRNWYLRDDKDTAIRSLFSRTRISLDERQIPARDTLHTNRGSSFLDFSFMLSKELGLDAALPPLVTHHAYEFTLDFGHTSRSFNAKNVQLGFDPAGRMMFIGTNHFGEDMWLAFAPPDVHEGVHKLPPRRSNRGLSTCLTKLQQRRIVIFFAAMLTKIGHRDESLWNNYPDVVDDDEFRRATNIHGQKIKLNVAKMTALHEAIQENYDPWIAAAPDSWRSDGFLTENVPFSAICKIGQNQPVGLAAAQELRAWRYDRKWDKIAVFSFAIATHVDVREVTQWEEIPPDEIWESNDAIYDSHTTDRRNLLSLEQLQHLPYIDDQGVPINIFDSGGYPIQRRLALYDPEKPHYGLLAKASSMEHLFDAADLPESHNDNMFVPIPETPLYYFYPQAGLLNLGHFQAHGLPPVIRMLMNAVGRELDTKEDEEGQSLPALDGIACQGYNSLMHTIRGNGAQFHDAQLGLVTRALSGQYAATPKNRNTAFKADRTVSDRYPHDEFKWKLENEGRSVDFRFENVYSLDVQRLKPERQTGEYIFSAVIYRLCGIWNHPSSSALADEVLEVLKPEVYPDIYNWSSFAITCIIERLWESYRNKFDDDPYGVVTAVEVCSVAERCLNFVHTGNMAVIATSVMYPMGVGYALIADGLPSFNTDIIRYRKGELEVRTNAWPLMPNHVTPKTSSRRSTILNYDESHHNILESCLGMAIVLDRPYNVALTVAETALRRVRDLLSFWVDLLSLDCTNLVFTGVIASINRQEASLMLEAHGRARRAALDRFRLTNKPLSYKGDGEGLSANFQDLILLLDEDPVDESKGMVRIEEKKTHKQLAAELITSVRHGPLKAPLQSGGLAARCLPQILDHLTSLFPILQSRLKETNINDWLIDSLAYYLSRGNIVAFVPWHKSRPGSSARVPSFNHWLFLRTLSPRRAASAPPDEAGDDSQGRARKRARQDCDSDVNAPWSFSGSLSDMGGNWNKQVLPEEWNLSHASLQRPASVSYVSATYHWVNSNIDLSLWHHRMALVFSILFTTVLPNVFAPLAEKESIKLIVDGPTATRRTRELAWIPTVSKNRRGCSDAAPYVVMMTTMIIALLEPTSPLRIRMSTSNGALGPEWIKKHTYKEISAINLIRMQVAIALKGNVLTSPCYGSNWRMRSLQALRPLFDTVMSHLAKPRYGVYFALEELFGTAVADQAAERGHTPNPRPNSGNVGVDASLSFDRLY